MESSSSGASRRALGAALEGLSICVATAGAALALYAMLGLPSNDHSGLGAVEGWAQFVFAVGVPLAACVAVVGSQRFRSGHCGPARAVAALSASGLSAIAWALIFFDWSA